MCEDEAQFVVAPQVPRVYPYVVSGMEREGFGNLHVPMISRRGCANVRGARPFYSSLLGWEFTPAHTPGGWGVQPVRR